MVNPALLSHAAPYKNTDLEKKYSPEWLCVPASFLTTYSREAVFPPLFIHHDTEKGKNPWIPGMKAPDISIPSL